MPKLSDEAWALLEMLYQASRGGPTAPDGFFVARERMKKHGFAEQTMPPQINAYEELKRLGFARQATSQQVTITEAGEVALRERSRSGS